jgi:RNA polymerase sigma-70 factor (ECF subfamily)
LDQVLIAVNQVIQRGWNLVILLMDASVQCDIRPVAPASRVALAWRGWPAGASRVPAVRGVMNDRTKWSGLIEAVGQRQDRAAFVSLFEYFAPRIKAFMLRSGASAPAAEEIAQETMLLVWRKAALFDPTSIGVAAWIFTIARNLRIDLHRREQRGGTPADFDVEAEFQIDQDPQPDAKLDAMEAEARVQQALTRLSPDQKRVIELSFFDEKAHGEIARILKIPLGTVKSRLRLAMEHLRKLLGELS